MNYKCNNIRESFYYQIKFKEINSLIAVSNKIGQLRFTGYYEIYNFKDFENEECNC